MTPKQNHWKAPIEISMWLTTPIPRDQRSYHLTQCSYKSYLCWSVPSSTAVVIGFLPYFQIKCFFQLDQVDLIGTTALHYFRELAYLWPHWCIWHPGPRKWSSFHFITQASNFDRNYVPLQWLVDEDSRVEGKWDYNRHLLDLHPFLLGKVKDTITIRWLTIFKSRPYAFSKIVRAHSYVVYFVKLKILILLLLYRSAHYVFF